MKFVKQIELDRLLERAEQFRSARPFPHIIVDGLFEHQRLLDLVAKFPNVKDKRWWVYDNPLEKKFALNDLSQTDHIFSEFFDEVNSSEFVSSLSRLVGIPSLVGDPALRGGGLHQTLPCGKLDVHEDFNVHSELNAFRRVNMIVYLNVGWVPTWGGELQLWEPDMSKCAVTILPIFNRSVMFRTDRGSNHGHPEMLACPSGTSRKSLAVYYYEPIAEGTIVEKRSTTYKKMPGEPEQLELDDLRARRALGRLEDKTTI